MATALFQSLCNDFCEAAGVAPQELTENLEGFVAFTARLKAVDVSIIHMPDSHPHSAFVLVDFGDVPPELEGPALRVLMHTNFALLGEEPVSSFSIHPVSGRVTLQATYALAGATGTGLLQAVNTLVDLALKWRAGYLLDAPAQHDQTSGGTAMAGFA